MEENGASRRKHEKANVSLNCDKMSCGASTGKQKRRTIAFNEVQLEQLESRKRSVRKSVRFNGKFLDFIWENVFTFIKKELFFNFAEDSCAACTPQKRQLKPSTPRKCGSSTRKIKFNDK